MPSPPVQIVHDRLDPKTYHPTLEAAVRKAYAKNIKLIHFPALIRIDHLPKDPVQWLEDISTVRAKSCDSCLKAGHVCIIHTGSSYRCLHCLLANGAACSHQEEMEDLGYPATPACYRYEVAIALDLTPMPPGFKWAGKKAQDEDLLERLLAIVANHSEDNTEESDNEEIDELAGDSDEAEPAIQTKGKNTSPRSTRRMADSNAELKRVLETRMDGLEALLQEVLRELKRKRVNGEEATKLSEFVEGSSTGKRK
ncbi:hypothetical protein L227DRAFT_566943 [Lentinus tigrinus ALCF2SS1-6]|uniref:Uncharacterized protein n=1 Tax=Lentinus tigrinus ALCF2SS1-6 TaxID=1328759 RepID=A0A5C2RTS3_9APHY|nr:hypothetical protein L227DRAFT_566943 [Lentinus tigrinus ALCF2SS1-6]